MIPIVNITGFKDIIGEKWARELKVDHIDLSKEDPEQLRNGLKKFLELKMCTGIIAKGEDGTVYHGRNFDN